MDVSTLLDVSIVPSCNPVQYQEKLMMQTREKGENPNFGSKIFFVGFISTS